MSGVRWEWREGHFDRLAGTDRLRHLIEEERPLEEILAPWPGRITEFEERRAPYLLYR